MSDVHRRPTRGHVLCAIVTDTNQIALLKDLSKPAPLLWKLPGGRIEWDETPEQAIIREIDEELRIKLEIGDLTLLNERMKESAGSGMYAQYLFGVHKHWRKLKPYKPIDPRFIVRHFPLSALERLPDIESSHSSLIREIELKPAL